MGYLRLLLIFTLATGCVAFGDSTIDTGCKIEIPVSVLKEEPTPEIVTRTALGNFTATLNGHPLKLSGLRANPSPRRFVLLLDQSGSMGDKLWPGELKLAKHFASSLSTTSKAGLISFNQDIQSKVALTSGAEITAKLELIKKVEPKGRTSIFSALNEAIDLLEPPQPGDIIYLLSDGGDNMSPDNWSKLRDRLQRNGIRLFAMILVDDQLGSPQQPATVEEREGWSNLRSVIQDSGGAYSLLSYSRSGAWNEKLMSEAAYAFYSEMIYDYLLELEIPKSAKSAMKLNLTFMNPQNRKGRYRVLSSSRIPNPCLSH